MIYTASIGRGKRDDIPCYSDYNRFKRDVDNAKIYKVLSHFWREGNSLWCDANIWIESPEKLFSELIGDADIGVFRHPTSKTLLDELEAIRRVRSDYYPETKRQYDAYGNTTGLCECGIIARRDNERVKRFNEIWWAEITRWGARDQMSFPKAVKDSGITINILDMNLRHHPLVTYAI